MTMTMTRRILLPTAFAAVAVLTACTTSPPGPPRYEARPWPTHRVGQAVTMTGWHRATQIRVTLVKVVTARHARTRLHLVIPGTPNYYWAAAQFRITNTGTIAYATVPAGMAIALLTRDGDVRGVASKVLVRGCPLFPGRMFPFRIRIRPGHTITGCAVFPVPVGRKLIAMEWELLDARFTARWTL